MSDSQNKCFCCKFNVSYHYLRPSGKNKEIWPFIAYDQPYGAHQASLSKTITPLKWNIIEYAKSRFSWASLVAQLVRIHLQCRRLGFDSWVWKIPWRRKWQPTPASCLENRTDRGAWQGTVHGVARAGHEWVIFTTNTTFTNGWN